MRPPAIVIGSLLLLFVLWDAFETVVLPRRVSRRFRLTRAFYRLTWAPWRAIARGRRPGIARENFLSIYGPLSLILLLGLWATGLIFGFALLQWGLGTRLQTPAGLRGFAADLYYSGTTLFTLGLGDVSPTAGTGRLLTVVEGGTGFAFLALVIGYLPTMYQAFSRREVNISLLDARAGSPPAAVELLRRHAGADGGEALDALLIEWERWSADLLETHISFPVLAYYRSQHNNQSWVAALTTVLDVSALIIAGLEKGPVRTARLTFAMARHAVVDMSMVFGQQPRPVNPDRLPPAELSQLREALAAAGHVLPPGQGVDDKLRHLRQMYEPYLNALGQFLLMQVPEWRPRASAKDNWERTALGS
jgi:Ion channel